MMLPEAINPQCRTHKAGSRGVPSPGEPALALGPIEQDRWPAFNGTMEKSGSWKMSKAVPPTVPASSGNNGDQHVANSSVVKRSIIRDGHKSSVSLEDQFWDGLREIAERERVTVSALVGTIDHGPNRRNLSSAIRVFVLDHFRRNGEGKLSIASANPDAPAVRTTPPQVS